MPSPKQLSDEYIHETLLILSKAFQLDFNSFTDADGKLKYVFLSNRKLKKSIVFKRIKIESCVSQLYITNKYKQEEITRLKMDDYLTNSDDFELVCSYGSDGCMFIEIDKLIDDMICELEKKKPKQMSIFDFMEEAEMEEAEQMKVLSLFSGIGAFEKALDYLDVKYELVNYCEIDKYASKSYSIIHNVPESMNLGDITKVDTSKLPKNIDLISYGFPCQDISLAGKQKGFFQENIMQALRNLEFTDDEIKNLYIYISTEKPSDSQLFDKLYDEYTLYEEDINALLLLGINKLTRSGLFFEALRIIEATKPKVAIAENVKNLTSKKFKTEFGIVLKSLEEAGYNNYWQVLNAKDYGVPQNRERVFIVSIRKDLDDGFFKFPEPFELKLRLKDMLEDEVDEKYYLSETMTTQLQKDLINKNTLMLDISQYRREGHPREYNDFAPTLTARDYKEPGLIQVGDYRYDEGFRERKDGLCPTLPATHLGTSSISGQPLIVENTAKIIKVGKIDIKAKEQCKIVYDPEGIAPTLDTMQGGYRQPKILIKNATKQGYLEAEEGDGIVVAEIPLKRGYSVDVKEESPDTTNIDVLGNYSKSGYMATQIVGKNGVAPTVRENHGSVTATVIPPLRIRKLTPTECFRLMGFEDEVINTLLGTVSNTQLYKQAGNSIVVDVLEEIFVELFKTRVFKNAR